MMLIIFLVVFIIIMLILGIHWTRQLFKILSDIDSSIPDDFITPQERIKNNTKTKTKTKTKPKPKQWRFNLWH